MADITTLSIDSDAKTLIKMTQKIVAEKNKIKLDFKDLIYLAFKRPNMAAELIGKNFNAETNEAIH